MARSVVFGDGERDGELDDGGAEVLLERIADGVLAADRRAAALELRDLVQTSPQAQYAVGAIGLPTLVGSLRDEREDPELMHGVLEALVAAVATGADGDAESRGVCAPGASGAPVDANAANAVKKETQPVGVGASVAEAFARGQGHLELVLSLLDDEDFYVRYHAVQLLAALASPCAHFLRGAVMSSPTGVGRLMDMMTEREVIRNETLLLLVSLTRQSEDLRKLVAFEGAFERCFNVVREEGASDGGVIVQDCLELCNNLLRGSPSNQTFFRESSFLTKLPELIDGKTPAMSSGVEPPPLSAQKAANLLCALELVTLLASDGDAREIKSREKPDESVAAELAARELASKTANRVANQAALVKAGVLEALLALSLGDRAVNSAPVRASALRCLGDLVAGSRENQDALFAAETRVRGDASGDEAPSATAVEPALLSALRVAIFGVDAAERVAAERVFARCLGSNPELQSVCVSTFAPVADDDAGDGDVSLGALLARALVGRAGGTGRRAREIVNRENAPPEREKDDRDEPDWDALDVSCRAAAVLRHVLAGNRAAQARLLSIPLEMPANERAPPELLLPRLVRYLSAAARAADAPAATEEARRLREAEYGRYGGGGDFAAAERAAAEHSLIAQRCSVERTQATLLRVLIAWLHGCAPAARAFLAPAAHLPVVADLARAESPHVAGLACVLLGCCLRCGDAEETAADVDAARGVLDVVVARVGLDAFFARWEEMRRSPEFAAAEAGPTLAPSLTRVTARRLAAGEPGEGPALSAAAHLYDADLAAFVVAFEQQVKERVISLYARPRGGVAASGDGDAAAAAAREAALDARPGESAQAHATRLKGMLRSSESELEAQRARNAVLAERLMSARGRQAPAGGDADGAAPAAGGGGPGEERDAAPGSDRGVDGASGGFSAESAELRASLDRAAAAAEQELRETKAELEEARMMVASSEENLRGLSEAYNGLELELARRDDELEALRVRVAASADVSAASAPAAALAGGSSAPDPAALAAAREEGRREAISEMAHRLEETEEAAAADVAAARERGEKEAAAAAAAAAEAEAEMSDLLACLGQEESKTEALMARLIEKHGENEADLEALLEECAEEADE